MTMLLRENCGVIGAFSLDGYNVTPLLIAGLEALQHRGQESWGIAVANHQTFKRPGIVSHSVDAEYNEISKINGSLGVGHVRYSTTAKSTVEYAQPIDIGGIFDSSGF
ncbi:MAG: hypothetical protein QXE71_04285, partial [Candidatus Bathyarchaeia archaeon]